MYLKNIISLTTITILSSKQEFVCSLVELIHIKNNTKINGLWNFCWSVAGTLKLSLYKIDQKGNDKQNVWSVNWLLNSTKNVSEVVFKLQFKQWWINKLSMINLSYLHKLLNCPWIFLSYYHITKPCILRI